MWAYFTEATWQFKVLQLVTPSGKKLGDIGRKLFWQSSLRGTPSHYTKTIERYHQHTAQVEVPVPAERLLVYSVGQSWKPFCAFLGVVEPSGEFPKVNVRACFKQTGKEYTRGAYAILALCALAFAGVVCVIALLFS